MNKIYAAGTKVTFTALRDCRLGGEIYRVGDMAVVTLRREWSTDDGIGAGGPWGYGGYTSRKVGSLGEVEKV
jgi:hypothetical protein